LQASYRVELSPAAQRQVRHLTSEDAQRVREALHNLSNNPRPTGSIKLAGFMGVWHIRARRVRIIYEVFDEERRLMVLRIASRDERTYRRL
jgi:mRNA interferase RelE/StbE